MKAVNVLGDSSLSDAITIRAAEEPDAPDAPTKLSSTLTSITIKWNAPGYNGGNPVNAYKVYIDDGLGGTLSYLATVSDLTGGAPFEYTASSLVNSRLYYFAVSAVNDVSEGDRSETTAILAATVPEAPGEPTTVS